VKKQLNKQLTLYFNSIYPYKNKQISTKANQVTIGIGGNIGNMNQRFRKLFLTLLKDSRFTVLQTSPLLKNPPFGYLEQDDFLNGIIILKTNLSAYHCLKVFQRYEYRFKRTRSFKDAPRTLDIDIIFYNNKKINTKELTIPHKDYKNRDSVLIPLRYFDSKLC
jgi:2-amino-4-hydroxy-6-hydroxymethyldihydropteridine diphosphokinase